MAGPARPPLHHGGQKAGQARPATRVNKLDIQGHFWRLMQSRLSSVVELQKAAEEPEPEPECGTWMTLALASLLGLTCR